MHAGTFSSVFKAIDLNYDIWDNRLWEGPQSNQKSDPASPENHPQKPAYVAIKRIIVTSSPRRILNELYIMETCRGCRHVAQLITAYRVEDQIVAVMPYQRSAELKVLYRVYEFVRGV
jgi:cell division control protein 7